MKIVDIIRDGITFIKERREHPILFPLSFIFVFWNWDICYALFRSNFPFEKMVDYIRSSISNRETIVKEVATATTYFFGVPILKLAVFIYGEFLLMLQTQFERWRNIKKINALQIKTKLILSEKEYEASKLNDNDSSVFSKIYQSINETSIVAFVNRNLNAESKDISGFEDGRKQVYLLLDALTMPSHAHRNAALLASQKLLADSTRKLAHELDRSIENTDEDIEGRYMTWREKADIPIFHTSLTEFSEAFNKYIVDSRSKFGVELVVSERSQDEVIPF